MLNLKTTVLALAVTILLACAASAAAATRYDVRFGIGDQNVQMFDDANYEDLELRQVRYFIPWNAMSDRDERLKARRWVQAARKSGARPFLHLSTDDLREKRADLPSVSAYRKNVNRLVRYFRKLGVRDFGAWNEANHKSQPTWDEPERAARYWKELRRAVAKTCSLRRCRAVGLDVLDQRGVERYVDRFVKAAGRSYVRRYLRIVGIHNYSDVNRKRTRGLRSIIDTVRDHKRDAKFWLTETGGVVKFGRSFPCHETRAANRLKFLFSVAKNYRRYLQRVYLYNWYGGGCDIRFDAGLVEADGTPRKGLAAVERGLRRFKR
jgi:hypothetical protein